MKGCWRDVIAYFGILLIPVVLGIASVFIGHHVHVKNGELEAGKVHPHGIPSWADQKPELYVEDDSRQVYFLVRVASDVNANLYQVWRMMDETNGLSALKDRGLNHRMFPRQ
jgi:hypothetical protein